MRRRARASEAEAEEHFTGHDPAAWLHSCKHGIAGARPEQLALKTASTFDRNQQLRIKMERCVVGTPPPDKAPIPPASVNGVLPACIVVVDASSVNPQAVAGSPSSVELGGQRASRRSESMRSEDDELHVRRIPVVFDPSSPIAAQEVSKYILETHGIEVHHFLDTTGNRLMTFECVRDGEQLYGVDECTSAVEMLRPCTCCAMLVRVMCWLRVLYCACGSAFRGISTVLTEMSFVPCFTATAKHQ